MRGLQSLHHRQLKLPFNLQFILLYLSLFFLFSQLHELSHILTGRMICGCYGEQMDFNTWSLCGNCFDENPGGFIPLLAGPAFSFIGIWTGVWLLSKKEKRLMLAGFLLVMINKPFARLFTVAVKGGDELNVTRRLLFPQWSAQYTWILTLVILLSLTIPPLIICYRKLQHQKKGLIIASFCIMPMIIQYFYQFSFLNSLLKRVSGLPTR